MLGDICYVLMFGAVIMLALIVGEPTMMYIRKKCPILKKIELALFGVDIDEED
jgi:hypothetical protein